MPDEVIAIKHTVLMHTTEKWASKCLFYSDTVWQEIPLRSDDTIIESSVARIIRLETAEREARRLIKSIFQEAIQHLNSANNMLSQNKVSSDELQQYQVRKFDNRFMRRYYLIAKMIVDATLRIRNHMYARDMTCLSA